jgi:glycosyltransferase involved in cell wall biosynthesis
MSTKHLVVSAVNLVEGGTLEILRQCLRVAAQLEGWRVTAIVNDPAAVGVESVTYIARPDVKPSWLKRIRFEYFQCAVLAEKLRPDFWLSLHDMTPGLGRLAGKVPQAVYCHNAMCFYRMPWREMWLDPEQILFIKLYPLFYRWNLRNNAAVVVQQDWIRQEFRQRFGCRNVVVAHPVSEGANGVARVRSGRRFFYPSFARVFKNFETVLASWEMLCADPAWDGELTVTVDGTVNRYGAGLMKRFGHLRNVRFIGRVSHAEVQALYGSNDCLVFASKLETWGMPISEAKEAGLSILAADLPYAHEAVGHYDGAAFFPAEDPKALAALMRDFRDARLQDVTAALPPVAAPFAEHWQGLLDLLLRQPADSSAATLTNRLETT